MRIIAGRWRSRLLELPGGGRTRPMPDRVREAVFSMLGSYYETPGELPPVRVADLFAGSGSLGIEALSRGAASCYFFERERSALDAMRRNLRSLHVGPEAIVVMGDAWREPMETAQVGSFDLVLLDPPYADSQDVTEGGAVERFLRRLAAGRSASAGGQVVVLHHSAEVHYAAQVDGAWRIIRQRSFGGNGISIFLL